MDWEKINAVPNDKSTSRSKLMKVKYYMILLAFMLTLMLSACDGDLLKESAGVTGGVGAGLSEYQE